MYYRGERLEHTSPDSDLKGLGPQVRRELANRIPRNGDAKVLDVGTGFARTAEFLARHLSRGSRIWTLDPSEDVLVKARARLKAKRLRSRVEFVRASITASNLNDEFFDIVVSVMVLHHIDDLRPALKEMLRVLGPRGRVLLADFKPEAADEFHFETRHAKSDFSTSKKISGILEREGAIVEARDFDFWYLVEGRKHAEVLEHIRSHRRTRSGAKVVPESSRALSGRR